MQLIRDSMMILCNAVHRKDFDNVSSFVFFKLNFET